MPRLRASLALALLVLPLAGCLSASTALPDLPEGQTPPAAFGNGTWPDGASARGFIESYVMTHPFRVDSPQYASYMQDARDDLAALLGSMGGNYSVVLDAYQGSSPGVNILAIKNGTTHPHQWVVLSAHYDTVGTGVGTTVYGAWDDGAGVATLLELARAFADWEFPFTVAFAFFDGEEKGLVGSGAFVERIVEDASVEVLANLNTDPPGLNWPCGDAAGPFPVKAIHGEVDGMEPDQGRSAWLWQGVRHGLDASKVPEAVRDFSPGIPIATAAGTGLTGGSDHQSFGGAGIANVFLGGTPTTAVPPGSGPEQATAAALTYPLHTPLDTLQAMDARCASGGPGSSLAGGLQTILDTFAHSLSWLANNPVPK
jgi:hypothetical protein